MLDRLADQSVEAIAAGGMSWVERGPGGDRTGAVDSTTGYLRSGRTGTSWEAKGYRRAMFRDRALVRVLSLLRPSGWLLPLMPLVHNASMDASGITVPGWARIESAGDALVAIAFASEEIRYSYGPQNPLMPRADERIRAGQLKAALKQA